MNGRFIYAFLFGVMCLVYPVKSGPMVVREGVVLLHGLARTTDSMDKMADALRDAGFAVVNQGYPSRTSPIQVLSKDSIRQALTQPELSDCAVIHFVTHSMGGILVREYCRRYRIPRLGRVVMLGPPNQGSEVVDSIGDWWLFKVINGPAGRELGTSSNSVPSRLGPVTVETGIIAGKYSINWINSIMIPGPDDGKVSVEHTKVAGMKEHIVITSAHPFLMKNPEAISLTIRFLKTGSFSEMQESESKE